jgi:hypothetical protein
LLDQGVHIGSLPSVWWSLEGYKCWPVGDLFVKFGEGTALKKPAITSPDVPPKVFEPTCCRILKLFMCGCVHMPILPNFVRGDNWEVSNLFINVFRVGDNAFWQNHWHVWFHD